MLPVWQAWIEIFDQKRSKFPIRACQTGSTCRCDLFGKHELNFLIKNKIFLPAQTSVQNLPAQVLKISCSPEVLISANAPRPLPRQKTYLEWYELISIHTVVNTLHWRHSMGSSGMSRSSKGLWRKCELTFIFEVRQLLRIDFSVSWNQSLFQVSALITNSFCDLTPPIESLDPKHM